MSFKSDPRKNLWAFERAKNYEILDVGIGLISNAAYWPVSTTNLCTKLVQEKCNNAGKSNKILLKGKIHKAH